MDSLSANLTWLPRQVYFIAELNEGIYEAIYIFVSYLRN